MQQKMRKKVCELLVIMMIFAAVSGFYGCSERDEMEDPEENPYDTNIDAGALAEYLADRITFADELTKVDNDIAYEIYGIEESAVSDIAVYMSTGATAEEIAVLTVKDDEGALLAGTAFNSRIESQKGGFENYVPEEIPKLENAVITQIDSAVVMIVCADTDEAEQAVDSYISEYLE